MAVVTIIGGHGKVALLAEPLLVERGHAVNALIRRPEQSEDIVTRGANPVVTDITALSTEEMAKLLTELGTEVLAAVLEDPSTIGKALPFIGGPTPIAQALASAPNSNKLR